MITMRTATIITVTIIMIMAVTAMITDDAALARLLVWFSPAFPTGAFSYSHGLEWAVEAGDVHDRVTLAAWIEGLLTSGSARTDAVLLARTHRAALAASNTGVRTVAELALALQPSLERRLESTMQGRAFLDAVAAGWPSAGLDRLRALAGDPVALPVAAGLATAVHGLPLAATLVAFMQGFVSNLVSAAVRLAPIGQSDGLRVSAALAGAVQHAARLALAGRASDLGGLALRSDIASMRHETQTTRLFRS